ncbi:phospholipase D family protein [Kingella negevensis]|uniref:phospholipase D family protein n=1 Tax=Kingella negevensis TaxID=1522312 RepID=UPI00050A0777|nr:phospholipase D family protein [Kingella negevensis]
MRYPILFSALFLTACQTLPDLSTRTPSIYIPTVHSERLEQALQLPAASETDTEVQATSETSKEPLFNGQAYVLNDTRDALAARIQLIENADVSIDAQYYIWHDDVSGRMLLRKLFQAAERGVRIRLLLDDNNTRGMDDLLAAVNAHPNIQIRLFNPFLHRKWRALGYLNDFPRVNRRMHNKSLTADNRASVVGGRNVGDEYFDDNHETAFVDMDVLVSGGIVTRISQEFDRYWRSDSAYPFEMIVKKASIERGEKRLQQDDTQTEAAQRYAEDLSQAPLIQAAAQKNVPFIQTQMQLVSDDPAKALDRKVRVNVSEEIRRALGSPQKDIYLVSPYFVPTKSGVDVLKKMVERGVKTTVLTNSLAATDVAAVHSGYVKYRKPMLLAGVDLYEFKADGKPSFAKMKDTGLTGSSSSSLHAKTFVVDSKRVFVGSFNLDPRSARLNTEMGLVLHSPVLAQNMNSSLKDEMAVGAYHVTLNDKGRLQWNDPANDLLPSKKEPEAGFFKRVISRVLSWLPIERLL